MNKQKGYKKDMVKMNISRSADLGFFRQFAFAQHKSY